MTVWRWSALGAILTLVIGASFALVPGIDACGPARGAGQWVDFQNITSVADVRSLIRPECADLFAPALRASMWLDALAFIPAYTLFLSGSMLALRRPERKLVRASLILLGGGVVADQIEGALLLTILADLPGSYDHVRGVMLAGAAKQLLLLSSTNMAGFMFAWTNNPWRWGGISIGVLSFGGILLSLNGYPVAELALLVSWFILAVMVVGGAVAERCAQRAAARAR